MSNDQCVIVAQNVAQFPSVEIVKINRDGERLWDTTFSTLWDDLRRRTLCDAESDLTGGVILVYEYEQYDNVNDSIRYYGINVMRISSDGDSLWTRNLYECQKEPGDQFGEIDPIINYSNAGCFFVAWADYPHTFLVVTLDVDGELL